MKHFHRWLFNLSAIASLLLCILVVAAWFLRTSAADIWTLERTFPPSAGDPISRIDICQLTFGGGTVLFDRYKNEYTDRDPRHWSAPRTSKFTHDMDLPDYMPPSIGTVTRDSKVYPPGRKTYFHSRDFHGFVSVVTIPGDLRMRQWSIGLPLWFLAAAFALLPLIWEIRYQKKLAIAERARRGFCAKCSYDLQATPDRCPECGTVPKKTRLWPWNVDYFGK